jgi:hypothetical protein
MARPAHVIVEHRRQPSACGTALGMMLLLGLVIEYWYIALAIVLLIVVAAAIAHRTQPAKPARPEVARRAGPCDPWLNEVAVALADLDLTETDRNTGSLLGGAQLQGDIGLADGPFKLWVNLFATPQLARQAETGMRANARIRAAISDGHTALRTDGRILGVANAGGKVVDEFRLEEAMRLVAKLSRPRPLAAAVPPDPALSRSPASAIPGGDPIDQLRRLDQLRRDGVITQAEFDAKKAELVDRI